LVFIFHLMNDMKENGSWIKRTEKEYYYIKETNIKGTLFVI